MGSTLKNVKREEDDNPMTLKRGDLTGCFASLDLLCGEILSPNNQQKRREYHRNEYTVD